MRFPFWRRVGFVFAATGVGLLAGCGGTGRGGGSTAALPERAGMASYYADALHGRPTASGEPYDVGGLTAAHRTLPFGSRVRVTNRANGQSVTVRVNDRGPFVAGRVIDLSRAAARRLDMVRAGVVRVDLELVDTPAARGVARAD